MKIAALILLFGSIVHAKSAVVTITYPDKEEKTFRFYENKELNEVSLRTKSSKCAILFGGSGEMSYVELTCSPLKDGKPLRDSLRLYATRAACGFNHMTSMSVVEGSRTKSEDAAVHLMTVKCEK